MGACRPNFRAPSRGRPLLFSIDEPFPYLFTELTGQGPWLATAADSQFVLGEGNCIVSAATGDIYSNKVVFTSVGTFADDFDMEIHFVLGAEGDPTTGVVFCALSVGIFQVALSISVDMTTRTGTVTAWGHTASPVAELPGAENILRLEHVAGRVVVTLNGATVIDEAEPGTTDVPNTFTLGQSEDGLNVISVSRVICVQH